MRLEETTVTTTVETTGWQLTLTVEDLYHLWYLSHRKEGGDDFPLGFNGDRIVEWVPGEMRALFDRWKDSEGITPVNFRHANVTRRWIAEHSKSDRP